MHNCYWIYWDKRDRALKQENSALSVLLYRLK